MSGHLTARDVSFWTLAIKKWKCLETRQLEELLKFSGHWTSGGRMRVSGPWTAGDGIVLVTMQQEFGLSGHWTVGDGSVWILDSRKWESLDTGQQEMGVSRH